MNHDIPEDRDEVWALLGKVRPVKASQAFTRNVLRQVRMDQPEREPGFLEWLRSGWNWAGFAGAAAAIALVLFAAERGTPDHAGVARAAITSEGASAEGVADRSEIEEVLESADFAVIANLDVLLDMDENDLWLEASAY